MTEGGGEDSTGRGAPAVFVSYASQDSAVANSLVEALELSGADPAGSGRDLVPREKADLPKLPPRAYAPGYGAHSCAGHQALPILPCGLQPADAG